jgi:hypothetical protein
VSTVNIVEKTYGNTISVPADRYELVLSFFSQYLTSETTAKAFAENLFLISQVSGIDVLELLDSFVDGDAISMTATMAFFMNSFSDKTIMYGVGAIIQPNHKVARNIVQ